MDPIDWLDALYANWRSQKTTNQRRYIIRQIREKGYEITPDGEIAHRVIYEEAHGRIKKGWVIHHIDGTKKNNDLSNLIALPRDCHDKLHKYFQSNRCWFTRSHTEGFLAGYLANGEVWIDDI